MRNIKTICDSKDKKLIQRTKYVFSQISHIVGSKFDITQTEIEIGNEDLVIYYGINGKDANNYHKRFISIPNFRWIEGRKDKKGQEIPYISTCIHYAGERIPTWFHFLELDNVEPVATYDSGGCAVGTKNGHVYFGFDLIMCIFHLLTCQEEYLIPKRDKFGRFLSAYSPRSKDNFLEQPTVNYYVMLLKQAIGASSSKKKQFYVILSHDVDNISAKGFWTLSGNVYQLFRGMYHLDTKLLFWQLKILSGKLFSHSNDYWNFETYITIERRYKAKSTFYFITGKRGRYGARYDLNDLKNVIHYLYESGWDVGLHTNSYSYHNWEQTKREKEDLENITGHRIVGSRSHYLRFNVPHNWRNLIKAGIKYDSSLGYPDTVGFRAGIAYPFFPYDLERDEILPIIEIPLVVMDNVLFEAMGLRKVQAIERVRRMIDRVAKVNGIITILWHSEALCGREFPGRGEVYEEILSYVEMKGGKFIREDETLKLTQNPIQ